MVRRCRRRCSRRSSSKVPLRAAGPAGRGRPPRPLPRHARAATSPGRSSTQRRPPRLAAPLSPLLPESDPHERQHERRAFSTPPNARCTPGANRPGRRPASASPSSAAATGGRTSSATSTPAPPPRSSPCATRTGTPWTASARSAPRPARRATSSPCWPTPPSRPSSSPPPSARTPTLAAAALRAGKHVLVEKPMATSEREAEELVRLAEDNGRTLMVDHTFLYSAPIRKIKELIDGGELGEHLLLRQRPHQPRAVPERRQRPLGSGPARPVHRRSPARPAAARRDRDGRLPHARRAGGHGLPAPRLRRRAAGVVPRQLAQPGEGAPPDRRGQQEEPRLQRPQPVGAGQGLRPRHHHRREQRGPARRAGQLPHRRHLVAAPGAGGAAAERRPPLRRLRPHGPPAPERRRGGAARRPHPGRRPAEHRDARGEGRACESGVPASERALWSVLAAVLAGQRARVRVHGAGPRRAPVGPVYPHRAGGGVLYRDSAENNLPGMLAAPRRHPLAVRLALRGAACRRPPDRPRHRLATDPPGCPCRDAGASASGWRSRCWCSTCPRPSGATASATSG